MATRVQEELRNTGDERPKGTVLITVAQNYTESDIIENLSKADIMLIMSFYQGGFIQFVKEYRRFVDETRAKDHYYVCDVHWFLKRQIR